MINISLHIQKLPPATGGGGGGGGYSDLHWGGGGTLNLVNSNLKSSFGGGRYSDLNFGQFKSEVFIGGGGGGTLIWTLVNSNLKSSFGGGVLWFELWSTQIWSLHLGGLGVLWSEIPERGALENLDKNLLFTQKPACASQIVSHILSMWRLIKYFACFNINWYNCEIIIFVHTWNLWLMKGRKLPLYHRTSGLGAPATSHGKRAESPAIKVKSCGRSVISGGEPKWRA